MQSYFFEKEGSQSNQEQLKKQEKEMLNPRGRFNQLSVCRPYPLENGSFSRIIIASFHMAFFLYTLGSYKMMTKDSAFLGIQYHIIQSYISSYSPLGLTLNLVMKILIISFITIEIVLASKKQRHEILYSAAQKVKKQLRVLIEVEYQLSSLLLLHQSTFSAVNFIVSLAIGAFALVFLENYNYLNDKYYVGSLNFLALLRLALGCGSVVNHITLFFAKNLTFFMFYHLIASMVLMYNYIATGWIIYKDRFLRWSLFSFIILYFTISVNLMVYHYSIANSTSFVIHFCITFVVVASSMYFRLKNQENDVLCSNQRIEKEVFVLFDILEKSHTQIEKSAMLAALLHNHSCSSCKNPKCFTKFENIYDSKRHITCNSKDFINEQGTLLRFYLQCRYETYLSSPLQNLNIIINYCELLFWRFKNINQTMYWLQYLQKRQCYLSFASLLKFNGLVDIVRAESQTFSEGLYNKNLDIQGLINAEKTYEAILSNTNIVLRERLSTWKTMNNLDIDLSQLRENTESIFERIGKVTEMWKQISKYLKHSNVWKQQYLFFILYAKDQKIKSKNLEYFIAKLQKGESLCELIGKSSGKFQLKTLLSDETCCLHIFIHDSKALIKRVSNNFTKFTGYTSMEILRSEMSLLLPPSSREYHQKILQSHFQQGRFQEQLIYKPKEVSLINKAGFIVPVFKIFKEYVTNNGELEYVTFLKKIQGKECIILCDQYLQIESFTENFTEELQLSSESASCMKHMNLLSIMPGLLDKSIFSEYKSSKENFKNIKSQQLHVTFYYSKDNLQIYLSQYLLQLQSISKNNLEQYYDQIKTLQRNIRENPIYFACDITFNTIDNSFCKYYEIKINQMKLKRSVKTCIQTMPAAELQQHEETGSQVACIENCGLSFERAQTTHNPPASNSNIFVKQQGNDAPLTNIYLQNLKRIWLIFALFLCATSNIKLALIAEDISQIRQLSANTQILLKLSCKSASLVNYYQSYILKLEQQQHLWEQIQQTTQIIAQLINQASIRKIIFNPIINAKAQYLPIISTPGINSSYDNIDIIYHMQSIFHSLIMQPNITTDNHYYQQMLAYFYPAFINNLNSSKTALHQYFQTYTQEIQMEYTLSFIIESFLFIVLIVSSFRANYQFNLTMGQMMKIHCQFNPNDLKRIVEYSMATLDLFLKIQTNTESVIEMMTTRKIKQQKDNEILNLNKKAKNILFGRKQIKRNVLYLVKTTAGVLLLLSFTIFTNIYVHSMIPPIAQIEEDGFKEFSLIPSRTIGANIIAIFKLGLEQQIDPDLYKRPMDNIRILANLPYQTQARYKTQYYQAVRDFHFSNVCRSNKAVIEKRNYSLSECEKLYEMTLTRGLVAFSGQQYKELTNIKEGFLDLSEEYIEDFYHALEYVGIFIQHLVSIWNTEYDNLCDNATLAISALTIWCNILILAVTFFILFYLLAYLGRQYSFYRQFYRTMMPNSIITEQKTIRSKLSIISFL